MRDTLHKEHKCKIYYEFMIQYEKKRQVAQRELHGSRNDNFRMLFNSKARAMKRSSCCVIEIGLNR